MQYAPGIRPAQRVFPSMFDMFGGNAPEDPEGFDDEAEFAARGRAGAGGRRRGRRGRRMAEHDRRGRVAVVARAAGPPARAAAGRRRDRHAGRAAGDERAAARPALGGRARAGDPRHLVPRHPGRRRRSPTCCSATSRRAASCLHAGRGPSARCRWCTPTRARTSPRTSATLLGRGEHAAVPLRARPELFALRVRRPRPWTATRSPPARR